MKRGRSQLQVMKREIVRLKRKPAEPADRPLSNFGECSAAYRVSRPSASRARAAVAGQG
jgi:hypothetical protein